MRGEETFQKLLQHIPLENFEYDPDQPPEILVSNTIRRVFVTLFAKYGDALTRLVATATGELTVHDAEVLAAVDGLEGFVDGVEALITATNALLTTQATYLDGLEGFVDGLEGALAGTLIVSADAQIPNRLNCWTGTAGDGWSAIVNFTTPSKVITVTAETNPLWLSLHKVGGGHMGQFKVPADSGISIACRAAAFKVKNFTGGSNSVYSVMSQWIE